MEWNLAQNIVIGPDLVAAAKQQLDFLGAVDRNRWLYEGPALDKAINRYYACWLPLLAKHSELPFFEGPLVVPLDCEWVWHCHRLNPVRYNSDCQQLYGTILDNRHVVSSIKGVQNGLTEQVWKQLYPSEPYELDLARAISGEPEKMSELTKCSDYDLVSAVKRQSPFFYQVSRTHMKSEQYLEVAVARYKGFLHLIRRNKERSIRCFCVPTYDIDLIWHTHQLHPISYCKDLLGLLGKILEHDDTDSDRTKGNKLDTGFSNTAKHWEETYGCRYWRAGAMYRGHAPLPLAINHHSPDYVTKKVVMAHTHQRSLHLPEKRVLEVMLEFVGLRNVPEDHKGKFFVSFSKEQHDQIFNSTRSLNIFSESGEKQVACFQCQASGKLLFELKNQPCSNLPLSEPVKTMGSVCVSMEELLSPATNLSMEKWLELVPNSKMALSKSILLRVAISVTTPSKAPYVLHMSRFQAFMKSYCLFPLPRMVQNWTHIIDDDGDKIISMQMRDFSKSKRRSDLTLVQEVIALTKSGKIQTVAELRGTEWSLIDEGWSFCNHKNSDDDGHIARLTGPRFIKYFPGRKLEYQPRQHCEKQRSENEFMTAVEFSAENPYGKAVSMVDFKYGLVNVKEEWLLLPGTVSAFILRDILRKEGCDSFSGIGRGSGNEAKGNDMEAHTLVAKDIQVGGALGVGAWGSMMKSSGCGAGRCGAGCGPLLKSGACGGGCGGGCGGCGGGSLLKSGGCGGCGGGCGSMTISKRTTA